MVSKEEVLAALRIAGWKTNSVELYEESNVIYNKQKSLYLHSYRGGCMLMKKEKYKSSMGVLRDYEDGDYGQLLEDISTGTYDKPVGRWK